MNRPITIATATGALSLVAFILHWVGLESPKDYVLIAATLIAGHSIASLVLASSWRHIIFMPWQRPRYAT